MLVLCVEVGLLVGAVGMVFGSEGVGEVVGYTIGSRNVVTVVLDRGTVDWDPAEDTLNLFQFRYLDLVFYPCPFAPGDDSLAPGSLDVAEGEAVPDAPVG